MKFQNFITPPGILPWIAKPGHVQTNVEYRGVTSGPSAPVNVQYVSGNGRSTTYGTYDSIDPAVEPEPHGALLLALMGILMICRRRRPLSAYVSNKHRVINVR